jgi:hypothetical protein
MMVYGTSVLLSKITITIQFKLSEAQVILPDAMLTQFEHRSNTAISSSKLRTS